MSQTDKKLQSTHREPPTCTPKSLPDEMRVTAAIHAIKINPQNAPAQAMMLVNQPTPFELAVITNKYWHNGGVSLTVGFLDNPPVEVCTKILAHMNAWSKTANVRFTQTNDLSQAQVRISRSEPGYWSYIGTDILQIAQDQPTMNLQGWSAQTPDSEYLRVVRHETGHTIGCPHEHMRQDLVNLIDPDKAIAYYGATQGWTPAQVTAQVLTPYNPNDLIGTAHSDENSIMCYQIPGNVTKNGQPILGGLDIDATDYQFIASIYPKPAQSPAAGNAATSSAAGPGAPGPANGSPVSGTGVTANLPGGLSLQFPSSLSGDELSSIFTAALKAVATTETKDPASSQ